MRLIPHLILLYIKKHPTITRKQLAYQLMCSRATLTRHLRKLCDSGEIAIHKKPHYQLKLTTKGEEKLRKGSK